MENQIFKSAILDFSVSSQHAIAEVPKITFSTQDSGGTAKLIFATKKDGVSLSLSNAAEISLAMIMSVGKDYESRYLVNPTIIDRVKGLIEYSLTDDQIGHDGQVEAELYVKYQNQTMQINRFSFTIEKAMIDDDFMPVQTYYVEKWDDYDKIFDDKVSVLQSEIDDLQAQSNDVRQQFDSFNLNQFTQKVDFENHIYNSDIHVTTENKISWEAKETPANAQAKADIALTEAKTYADSILDEFGAWINLPLNAGFSTGDGNVSQYRLIRKHTNEGMKTFVEFRGAVAGTFSSASNSLLSTMPVGARPVVTYYGSGASNNGNGGRIAIPVNGQVLQVSSTNNANPSYVGLSTIFYEVGN
ncbi:phage baseplate upper protein [Listeria monocytogenes]|nr:phage baseplate upper protein [Listeria monocytogenes]EAG8867207.1 phage baseplate upper protein [Listeria monocytogenes]HAB0528572.1 hypothetical protein [Listeria monocytogenes]HAB0536638.1 hypothetical protein [Listeria monocytogenes]HAB0546378.1 hypothetical protein [Listeria monocytogenes]